MSKTTRAQRARRAERERSKPSAPLAAWDDPLADLLAFFEPGLESGNPMFAMLANEDIRKMLDSPERSSEELAP